MVSEESLVNERITQNLLRQKENEVCLENNKSFQRTSCKEDKHLNL